MHTSISLPAEKSRFWELDALKGIAITLVVFYHVIFDLDFFGLMLINSGNMFFTSIGTLAASLFIFVSGICLQISLAQLPREKALHKLFKRTVILGLCALGITVITLIVMPEDAIYFGILHFLLVSALIGYFLVDAYKLALLTACICFGLYPIISSIKADTYVWLWLGIEPYNFSTLDYFPLVSWFGVFALGIASGQICYNQTVRNFFVPDLANKKLILFLQYLGQNTLVIYLVHQPILLTFMLVLQHVFLFLVR